jgi:hypothetical protein
MQRNAQDVQGNRVATGHSGTFIFLKISVSRFKYCFLEDSMDFSPLRCIVQCHPLTHSDPAWQILMSKAHDEKYGIKDAIFGTLFSKGVNSNSRSVYRPVGIHLVTSRTYNFHHLTKSVFV